MLSSDVIRQLESAGLAVTRPEGRRLMCRLTNPQGLLDAWTTRYRWDRNAAITVSPPMANEDRFLRRLAKTLAPRRWALTLLAGAWRRIQYTPTDTLHLYIECENIAELRSIANEAGWPADPAGRVVLMKPAYRTAVWFEGSPASDDTPPIVSDLQLILDLWHYPERGRETATQLWRPMLRRFEDATAPVQKLDR